MDENTFNELQISYLEMRGIAEPREARGGREKKCSKMCNRGGGGGQVWTPALILEVEMYAVLNLLLAIVNSNPVPWLEKGSGI